VFAGEFAHASVLLLDEYSTRNTTRMKRGRTE
jgi:hypothetical protein